MLLRKENHLDQASCSIICTPKEKIGEALLERLDVMYVAL
jgi:hypothetical protein